MSQKIYQMMTDRILAELENGVIPWKKPWKATGLPKNLISKKAYRGMNVFTLGLAGYGSPFWATFKQVGDLGGKVRKGERGFPICFWNFKETDEINPATGKCKTIPLLRFFTVFNTEQTEGIDPAKIPTLEPMPEGFDPIAEAQAIIDNMPNRPTIQHGGDQAFYKPSCDLVNMPNKEKFFSPQGYFGTFFHELGHSSGHVSRLGRHDNDKNISFGSCDYSKEELVAELTAAFLCGVAGIEAETIQNSAAYIDGWRKKISTEPKLVICAAAQAQKAADFILGNTYEEAGEGEGEQIEETKAA